MDDRSKYMKVGRPRGTIKDPNRLKIMNPNGQKIDVDGVQYNKYIRQGYITDGTRLILPDNIIPKVSKVGRPKGCKNKIKTDKIINTKFQKVENPDTKRMIKTDNVTFKRLSKKYYYNPEKNEFYKYVNDPKKPDVKLDVTGEEVKKYEKRGYIFNREKNIIITPGKITESAKKYTLFDYDLHIVNEVDPIIQMKLLATREEVIIKRALKIHKGLTFNTSMEIEFIKNDGEVKNTFTFTPKLMTINSKHEISNARQVMNAHINGMIDRYTNQGSGWVINRIMRHFISINRYIPLAAKSYIKLPPIIQNKKATINIQNKDNKCFMYCLGRALDPNPDKNHLEKVSKHLKNVCIDLGLDKIKMPVPLKNIPKIERDFNVDINLFGFIRGDIYPLSHAKETPGKKMVNLLYTSNEETNHYVLIKDFDKLCCKITKDTMKKNICMNCIQNFPSKERLQDHKPNCIKINGSQAVKLPKEGSYIKFRNLKNTLDVPFVIYADFESILIPLEIDTTNNSQTTKTHEHKPCSYGYKVVCKLDDKLSVPYKTYKGEDCIEMFFKSLFDEADRITDCKNKFRNVSDMIITEKQLKEYKFTDYCYACKKRFTGENYKVKDHCHVTGLYRGPACNKCNLKLALTRRIPVVFHNLRGYDSHLLMQKLGSFKDKTISVIPNNMEKYMSFSVASTTEYYDETTKETKTKILHELTFIDSLQFMPSSLSQLVNNLKSCGIEKFKYTNQEFKANTEIMTRKGVYPYSFLESWKKFKSKVKNLTIKDFKNDLTGDDISEEDFEYFKFVCKQFNIKTLGKCVKILTG